MKVGIIGIWYVLKNLKCNDKLELHQRERYWLEQLGATLNRCVPTRSKKEYQKEYYEDNKNNIKDKSKQYYIDNKDKIRENQKQYYIDNKDT